jgi:hypothetical protein
VFVYAEMDGVLKAGVDGTGNRGWDAECVMRVRLSGDGTRVVEIQNFVGRAKISGCDTGVSGEWWVSKALALAGLVVVGAAVGIGQCWYSFRLW